MNGQQIFISSQLEKFYAPNCVQKSVLKNNYLKFSTSESYNFARILQLSSLFNNACGERINFLSSWTMAKNNSQHRQTPLLIPKKKSNQSLKNTKSSHVRTFLETYGQRQPWPFSICCIKNYLSSSFWDIYWDIYDPKKTKSKFNAFR